MKCTSENDFPKKLVKTDIHPDVFNDDLYFKFTAEDVHTSDPKEIERMFAELDDAVAHYKKIMRDHLAKET